MTRILLTLASISIVLLITALALGLTMGDVYARPEPSPVTRQWATIHLLTGLAAALMVVFVECVIVTYFIGTSRWCKEVVETYQFDRSAIEASNRLKRRTFPWALAGMLVVVGIIALGAASDPASRVRDPQSWANWHLGAGIGGITFIIWSYVVAWNNVAANHAIIDKLVAEVDQIRRERGISLPSDDSISGRQNPDK
jgi:H+/gluconate symporter-like permease